MNSLIQRITKFIQTDIWNADLSKTSFFKKSLYQLIKVLMVAFQGIKDDKVSLRASALTFFSLLSIVPVFALAFGLAKGFGLDKQLRIQILENFKGQEEVLLQSLEFAEKMLANTQGGLVAGIGFVFLFYSVMKLMNNIEVSFNDIWYVSQSRSITRKMTDYLAVMLFGPVLMIVANAMTVFVSSQIAHLTETVNLLGLFKSVIFPLLRLLPFMVIWLVFTLLYLIMPNTHVKFKSALIGGILAGSAFQIMQWGFIRFEVNMSQYNAIYGSFAALPLFLMWLQFSWLIVLYGSEVSYAVQNVNNYESNVRAEGFSNAFKRKVALATSLLIIQNFKAGKPAIELNSINSTIKVPNKLLIDVIQALIACNVLTQVKVEEVDSYQPAIDTDLLSVEYIISKYDEVGESIDDDSELMTSFSEILKNINETISQSKHNHLMKEM
jgi:membrane protein